MMRIVMKSYREIEKASNDVICIYRDHVLRGLDLNFG